MLFDDARSLPQNVNIETDVCIVGAGAAGITLAREFTKHPFRVCLLESGGLKYNRDTQSLYEGETTGIPYFPIEGGPSYDPLAAVRLRYFGGTTNHWGGWCRPFDEIDFEARDWIPDSGWPFRKSHLDPFYRRGQAICQLGPFVYDVEAWETQNTRRLPFASDRVITKIFQISPPTRFGEVYRDEIVHADNIRTLLYANVVDIETNDNARTVTRVRVVTLEGNRFTVTAKLFILAAGGIENPRLLLLSNTTQRTGLGNHRDLVGRFFMEHQELEISQFLPSNPNILAGLYIPHTVKKKRVEGRITAALTVSPDIMRKEKLVNFTSELELVTVNDGKGVVSLKNILSSIRKGSVPDNLTRHLKNIISDIDNISTATYRRLVGQQIVLYKLLNASEQVPNKNSRVTLSTSRDKLGKNRVRLDWRLSPIDRVSLKRGYEIIGQELGRAGLGRLKSTVDDDTSAWSVHGQCHHMGTTRMHTDPQQGVVNENCQVHGISNLFIAGSSVFPTSGSATPTLTIVALAIRLADHVKGIMR
jgi:choline dehydrogenase-like flavoprotein